MLEDIKRWLAHELIKIDSVRTCTIKREEKRDPERDPSIIAHTWGGTIIYVHLLDDLLKSRAIKRIVSENTRSGVGTLFLLDADFLPDDGERFNPDESLWILHALYRDKIYTYRVDDEPHIGQVHFKSFGKSDQIEVWYGPDVQIAHLPAYRVWVKNPSVIKGDWLIANFGTEAFWKQAENSAAREQFRRQYRRETGQTWQFVWNGGASWAVAGGERVEAPPPPPKVETKLDRSYVLLGVEPGAAFEEVKAAFRRMARDVHPDVSQLPKDEAETRFKLLNEAYTYIKVSNRWT